MGSGARDLETATGDVAEAGPVTPVEQGLPGPGRDRQMRKEKS